MITAENFNNIPPHELRILQVLSIYWEQVTQKDLSLLLEYLDIKDEEGRKYSQKAISGFRADYIRDGLLDNTKELWGNGFQISTPELKEALIRTVLQEKWFESTVFAIQRHFNRNEHNRFISVGAKYKSVLLRDYRLSVYQNEQAKTEVLLMELEELGMAVEAADVLYHVFSNPFQHEFLAEFDHIFQINVVVRCFRHYVINLKPTAELWEFTDKYDLVNAPIIKGIMAEELVLKGQLDAAKKLIGNAQDLLHISTAATIAFLKQDYSTAVTLYEASIKAWRKLSDKRKGYSGNWQMFLYGLSLYKTDEPRFHDFAEKYSAYADKNFPDLATEKALNAISLYLKNHVRKAEIEYLQITGVGFYSTLLRTITAAQLPGIEDIEFALKFENTARDFGFEWVGLEVSNLISSKGMGGKQQERRTSELREKLGFEPVGNIIPKLENWERALNSLMLVAETVKGGSKTKAKANETRLAWLVDLDGYQIQPVEQKFTKQSWTKGRNIALKRLYEGQYKKATDHDMRIVRTALRRHQYYSGFGGTYTYDFDWDTALTELTGHPLLFSMKNRNVPIEFVESEPALVIKENDGSLELSFDVDFSEPGIEVQKETELRYKILKISKHHVEIANSLKDNKLRVPKEGRDMLLKAILPLSKKISIQSDLEEHFEELPFVEPETRIHALLTQSGEGFHLEFFIKPFGSVPPYFKPGKGGESVIAEIDGVRSRTKRDLESERSLLDEVEASCPFLAKFESQNYEWYLDSVEECLTAMTEMETPRIAGKLVVEWTKGQKLKLLGNITTGNFSLRVKSKNEWFEVDGKAEINEDLVLSIKELRGLLGQNNSNFIELSDGQFVAITESLRRHLQSIDAVLDDKNRLHHLRSGILEEISEELEHFKADKAWKAHLEKIVESRKFKPVLPATFEADLRPYQLDGFNWLSRLAHWGVGACLADDMGLGKTLQALAVLVERAELGPALVVAPVSVCRNWVREAMRFSPTLNFQIFGTGDRNESVKTLGKFDVLVTSYNLLQTEEDLLIGKQFATVVLDEAQAVKNRNTKRSRTVMKLNADFRMVTTGTPIENHLGELWNLFNFINPGLLGSPNFFNERFAIPIERDKDDSARKTLQRLVQPFILRRRKNEVLDDLPAKTEIVLTVEMSEAEAAFYEALRREAMETIEADGAEAKGKRFRILAQLTRLRLACCHPKLVDPNIPLEGSKLALFGETLEELLDNKHKALVFSQFVKHLSIVEEYLKEKGISYQYLDGSTPAAKRQERIDDFQRGKGDVFLISLKAGGTGLNLTAADYVIHLDPWWNPAVEDQATDRVHRIGQKRPVTVYRLVTENTVEEKILKLHETKRDLADSLLAGTDSSGKLSTDDLIALIHEGHGEH